MSNIYPDIKNLFAEKRGRKSAYTPQQICDEFVLYVEDLKNNPIIVETEYRQQAQGNNDMKKMTSQIRRSKHARPPKLSDFVYRWLGMSTSWWRMLPTGKRGKDFLTVKEKIEQYCYDCKFDGAVIGIYNANIIARDLGLKDKLEVEQKQLGDDMTIDEINKEIERLSKIDTKG